jgi:type I restriction enzyme S subunit
MKVTPLPGGWEQIKMKELCNQSPGKQIGQKEVYGCKGPYPVYGSASRGGGITGYSDTYDHAGERVTWVKYGPHAGSTAFRMGRFSTTYLLGALKVKDEEIERVDARFLRHALGYQGPKFASTTRVPRLTNSMILEINIGLPPLPEQRKIAKLLDSIEEAVVMTEKAIEMTVTVRDASSYRSQAARVKDFKLPVNERRRVERLFAAFDEQIEVYRKRKEFLKRLGNRLAWELLTGKTRFHVII